MLVFNRMDLLEFAFCLVERHLFKLLGNVSLFFFLLLFFVLVLLLLLILLLLIVLFFLCLIFILLILSLLSLSLDSLKLFLFSQCDVSFRLQFSVKSFNHFDFSQHRHWVISHVQNKPFLIHVSFLIFLIFCWIVVAYFSLDHFVKKLVNTLHITVEIHVCIWVAY